jgi:peptide methionine sulfoxide reductase msrA/msrB
MKIMTLSALVLTAVLVGLHQTGRTDTTMENPMETKIDNTRSAVFAGGCFWCTESDFEKVDGVIAAVSGYTGGHVDAPTYKQVSSGGTGHIEAVKIVYDPTTISYEQLLDIFWRHVDPTDAGGQFVDRGDQYRSAIFYADEAERRRQPKLQKALAASGQFRPAHRHRHSSAGNLLRSRRLSPGLLQEKPAALQMVSLRIGPRPVPGKHLGRDADGDETNRAPPRP